MNTLDPGIRTPGPKEPASSTGPVGAKEAQAAESLSWTHRQELWALVKEMKLDVLKLAGGLVPAAGGLLFLVYCFHIGYLPAFSVGDWLSVFVALALTSLFFYVVWSFGLVGAGFMWSVVMLDVRSLSGVWTRGGKHRHVPGFLLYVAPGLTMAAALSIGQVIGGRAGWVAWCAGMLSLGAVVPWAADPSAPDSAPRARHGVGQRLGVAAGYLLLSNVLLAPQLLATRLLYEMIGAPAEDPVDQTLWVYASFFMVVVVNGTIASAPRANLKRQMVLGTAILAVLLTGFMAWHYLPAFVFRVYGWGSRDDVTLLLDRTGCEIAATYGLSLHPTSPIHQDVRCELPGAHVLNALGKEYYLQFVRSTGQEDRRARAGDTIRLTLPARTVVSTAKLLPGSRGAVGPAAKQKQR